MVAQRRWRWVVRGEESATGDRRVPRTDSRSCQYVVKAGRESSVANEYKWIGWLLDDDCLLILCVWWNAGGAMTTMEQAVSHIQRELLMIRAQIASRVHEDAPSPIDVNHRDDAGVGFGSTDGSHNDSDRSWVLADGFERGSKGAHFGASLAAYAWDAYDVYESRSKRHCCQLAEEPTGGVATTTWTIRSYWWREEKEYLSLNHVSWTMLSSGTPSGNWKLGDLCSTLREAEGQDGRRDQAGWPGIFGAWEAWESLDFQLQPFADFRGCALGDRDVRGGENWFKNSQTERSRFFAKARIPLMLWLSALFCRAKENGHQISAVGVWRVMQHNFNETAMQASTWANKREGNAIRASHGPWVNLQSQA